MGTPIAGWFTMDPIRMDLEATPRCRHWNQHQLETHSELPHTPDKNCQCEAIDQHTWSSVRFTTVQPRKCKKWLEWCQNLSLDLLAWMDSKYLQITYVMWHADLLFFVSKPKFFGTHEVMDPSWWITHNISQSPGKLDLFSNSGCFHFPKRHYRDAYLWW